jgi:hypothetical protein
MVPYNPITRRAFLGAAAALTVAPAFAADRKKKLVMLAGKPSHGPMEHEFNAGVLLLAKCLGRVPGLEVVHYKGGWPDSEKAFEGADGIFCYADGGAGHPLIQGNRLSIIGDFMKRGVGLMCAHYGVEVPKDKGGKEFQEWIGGYYEDKFSCNPMWEPDYKEFPEHAISRGVKPFTIRDEWYFNMRFRPDMKGVTSILSAKPSDAVRDGPYVYPKGPYKHIQEAKGRAETMMWAVERPDGGRGVGFTGGHYHKNWLNDNFRKVVLNAAVWICKADVPKDGVEPKVTEDEIKENLDPKTKR